MDRCHKRHSDGTYWLMRAEHLALAGFCAVLAALHFQEMNLGRFAFAFLAIDAVGYLPGLLVYLRRRPARIPPCYHYLYNLTHSYLAWAVIIGLWRYFGDWEWAMLAAPIHLSGDRGVFGNVFKPVDRAFEPTPEPPP
jgi:hypothetical protein